MGMHASNALSTESATGHSRETEGEREHDDQSGDSKSEVIRRRVKGDAPLTVVVGDEVLSEFQV
jgi:hypothetical protein